MRMHVMIHQYMAQNDKVAIATVRGTGLYHNIARFVHE
jgi:hypothetical protein